MKEIIRFRGKRIDNGEWVYGYYCYNPLMKRAEIISYDDVRSYIYEVDPATVGQYTGLKDKNGKEIYEGDILHHKWNRGNDIFLETISEVKFSRGAFVVDDKKRADWLLSLHALPKWAEIEVIGNIYENPGLLEVE